MSTDNPENPTPEESLSVEQLLARQEEFTRLFAQHESAISGFVLALVPAWDDAADISQETSLVLWRKFGEFERGSNFLRWACRIAELEVRRYRDRKRRERLQFNEELLAEIAAARLDATEDLSVRQRALNECLAKLRLADREVLVARYVNKQPGREIAKAQGCPVGTVYTTLQRTRAKLFECINRTISREGSP